MCRKKDDIKFLRFDLDNPDESFKKLEEICLDMDLKINLKKVYSKFIIN